MTLSAGMAHAATISIPVENYVNLMVKKSKDIKDVSLTGTIQVINLGGPVIILETADHMRVTVYSAPTMDVDLKQQLRNLEATKATVRVQGSLANVCSPALYEAQQEKALCRLFDNSKKVAFDVL